MLWLFNKNHSLPFMNGLVIFGLVLFAGPLAAQKGPGFIDVSWMLADGPAHTSHVSFGAGAWGDLNGDKFPDLFCGNHARPSALFLNQNGQGFKSILEQVSDIPEFSDVHGAAWADFDNDNDLDLLVSVGSSSGSGIGPNWLLHNESNLLLDVAPLFGVDRPEERGRMPIWLDFNLDGSLDLILTNANRLGGSTEFLLQGPDHLFGLDWDQLGIDRPNVVQWGGMIADLNGDGLVDVSLIGHGTVEQCYTANGLPLSRLDGLGLGFESSVADSVAADFNGDLKADVYVSRFPLGAQDEVVLNAAGEIRAFQLVRSGVKGFDFTGPSKIHLGVYAGLSLAQYRIGAMGRIMETNPITLDAMDAANHGLPDFQAGQDIGMFIGFDSTSGRWQIRASSPDRMETRVLIQPVGSGVERIIIFGPPDPVPPNDRLYFQVEGGFQRSNQVFAWDSLSAVAADFDNDRDVDLYLVRSGMALNRPNLLLLNDGTGRFSVSGSPSQAEGSSGGVGDSVTMVDFDLDGAIDLFLTHGNSPRIFADTPIQLLRNLGNKNHWVEVDLEGTVSNRDGIGARVLIYADGVTQMREQNGGGHRVSQNHSRIHFGLGPSVRIDKMVVEWPSGIRQVLENLPVDRLLQIQEPTPALPPGHPNLASFSAVPEVHCSQSSYDDSARIMVKGISSRPVDYQIRAVFSGAHSRLRPLGLSKGDHLVEHEAGFIWSGSVDANTSEGVQFDLPPGAEGLMEVTLDGKTSGRWVYGGPSRIPLAGQGWVFNPSELPSSATYPPAPDGHLDGIGLVWIEAKGRLQAVWGGGSQPLREEFSLITSYQLVDFEGFTLEPLDVIQAGLHGGRIFGMTSGDLDGCLATISADSLVGVRYSQNGMIPFHRVSSSLSDLPRARPFPRPSPYGSPQLEESQTPGIFLWKDPRNLQWRLRVVGGANWSQVHGRLRSTQPRPFASGVGLESGDIVNGEDPYALEFFFNVGLDDWDGLNLTLAEGSNLFLEILNSEVSVDDVYIGEHRWPVLELPIMLGVW